MEASTRLAPVHQHQVTLRGGAELAMAANSMQRLDQDRRHCRRHRDERGLQTIIYVNQVTPKRPANDGDGRQQFCPDEEAICRQQPISRRRALATRRKRMSDFSDQTLAKLNDLKLDEAPARLQAQVQVQPQLTPTCTGPQARHKTVDQRRKQRQQMELAEAQQEQPLVSRAHEGRFESAADHGFQQPQQQASSHFDDLEQVPHMQTGGHTFAAAAQAHQHQAAPGNFAIFHPLGLDGMHSQAQQFAAYHGAEPALFHTHPHAHTHYHAPAAYYSLLRPAGPAHQTADLVHAGELPSAANYADLDETTRQRHHQQQQQTNEVKLPDSVQRLNQLGERSHQRLSSSTASSHELHQSKYSAAAGLASNQEPSQQQEYYDSSQFGHWNQQAELTALDAVANSSLASSSHELDHSANLEQQQQQQQHFQMSNLGARPHSDYLAHSELQLLSASHQSQVSVGQFDSSSAGAAAHSSNDLAGDTGDELKVCEWFGCSSTFLDMAEFVRHLEEVHVNQEPREKSRYFCLWSNCKRNNQEFNARYKLLIHMRVHSGEKPYACNSTSCNKSFSRLENLKIHVRSHTGHKPYKCTHGCSKSFTNSSDRIKHHKTHKDPKPYNCTMDGCTKRYTDPSSLRKHLRAHKRHGGRELGQSGGQTMFVSSSSPLRHSTLSSCDLNSSGYHNSSSYQYYSSSSGGLQQPAEEVQYSSDIVYDQQQQQQAETCQLNADYDPAQDFVQTYFAPGQSQLSSSAANCRAAEQQFSRSFCAPSTRNVARNEFIQQETNQQYRHEALESRSAGDRRRLELSAQHQALSRSWCAGAPSTRPARQTAQFVARPLHRPLNSSDNLLRPQQAQPRQQQQQQEQWTSSGQQPWPSGAAEEGFNGQPANKNNNRQLQDSASWGQNQFVSNQQQQQLAWRGRRHEQLMRSMPSGDTFAATVGADSSGRWQQDGAK